MIELVLPCGTLVRVPPGADAAMLRTVLSALREAFGGLWKAQTGLS